MYLPEQFREERADVLRAFIAAHPLGALVTSSDQGLTADHIPMRWREHEDTPGVLYGHVARANAVWKNVAPGSRVLVIFGGAERYISPSWYPSKQEHGKVVPTWNYSVVHAHGTIQFSDSAEMKLRHVRDMTDQQEGHRNDPWHVSDAPSEYIERLLNAIVAFEIHVDRLIGKFKASQHRPEDERRSVADALAAEGTSLTDVNEVVRAPARS
jgi:transcriptional regulator